MKRPKKSQPIETPPTKSSTGNWGDGTDVKKLLAFMSLKNKPKQQKEVEKIILENYSAQS